MAIQAVLFDAVGTIIEPRMSVAALYQRAALRHGVVLNVQLVHRRFKRAAALHFEEDVVDSSTGQAVPHATDQAWEVERWRRIVADVLPEVQSREAVFESLWTEFANRDNWRVFDDVAPCWSELRQAGITIGIASNFDERLRGICAADPVLSQAEHLFISSSIGFRKPSPKFYEHIARTLQLQPHKLLMVGDDHQSDYIAPRVSGWSALHLDREAISHNTIANLAAVRPKLRSIP